MGSHLFIKWTDGPGCNYAELGDTTAATGCALLADCRSRARFDPECRGRARSVECKDGECPGPKHNRLQTLDLEPDLAVPPICERAETFVELFRETNRGAVHRVSDARRCRTERRRI